MRAVIHEAACILGIRLHLICTRCNVVRPRLLQALEGPHDTLALRNNELMKISMESDSGLLHALVTLVLIRQAWHHERNSLEEPT